MGENRLAEDDKICLYLLTEKHLRKVLSNLYNAIRVNENAIFLQRGDPWKTDPAKFGGSQLVKDSMEYICGWVEHMRLFTKNDQMFDEQFLRPVQVAANVVESYRTMSPRTTDIEGWIFSKSRSYSDPVTGDKKVILSIVVPSIKTVMTVRVDERVAEDAGSGFFIFSTSQPVPVVNRIHQTHTQNKVCRRKVALREFDFLFVGFGDIERLGESIEMENYCEVESVQSERRQHLGFPFVSSARIISVSGSTISLLRPYGEKAAISMQISRHLYEHVDPKSLEGMVGKTVRFFGVQWYKARSKKDVRLEHPEVFLVEPEEDEEILKIEDAVGIVRIRGRMPVSEIEGIMGTSLEHPKIKTDAGFAYFDYGDSPDPIHRRFQSAMTEIRELRLKMKTNAFQITEDHVIDRRKMKTEGIASLIRCDRTLYDVVTNHLLQVDTTGCHDVEKTIAALPQYAEGVITRKISFMEHLGVFKKTDSGYDITRTGFKIVSRCIAEDLDLPEGRIMSLMDAGGYGIPPSVMLDCLRNGTPPGFFPVVMNGRKTEVFWSRTELDAAEKENLMAAYAGLRDRIMGSLLAVSHPMTDRGIYAKISGESEGAGRFVIQLVLSEESGTGKVRRDGDSWEYPLDERVRDLFEANASDSFAVDDVVKKTSMGTIRRTEIMKILSDLEKSGFIAGLGKKWTRNVSMGEKRARKREEFVRHTVLGMIKKGPVSLEKVSRYSDGILARAGGFRNGYERRRAISEQINRLAEEGLITVSGGMVSGNS